MRVVLVLIFFYSVISSISPTYGFDPLDPHANITIKWDLMQSTPDASDVRVSLFNYQLYRHIDQPGWRMSWDWTGDEVIWNMWGAETTEQGNCTKFRGTQLPYCCEKSPVIIDLMPGAPYNLQTANCCKGGTWNVTCAYSQFLASSNPTCCVSLSAFYNNTIVPCPKCSCNCQELSHTKCPVKVICSQHMCPIRVHWHVKQSYKEYWRVKMTVTNLNVMKNYSNWNLVVLHPNLESLAQAFSFNYRALDQYGYINDTGMLWGIRDYNDVLLQAGDKGNVQTEMILHKDPGTFTFREGWAFPRRILFNGDECVMPLPDDYPRLPNSGHSALASSFTFLLSLLVLTTIL
ncbi:hypothetical protein Patl1_11361 [Pistacia atlantica]|uniref:Uncharacterized protein n=1 Tax=Pistacia atlantica TaxID=434234 RepID=A0ACC1A7B2_9ROSI|nr:hypothetical protein Patl1_11361 [Pistacia atlantica]